MGSVLDPSLLKAIEWMVLLRSGEAGAADQAAFDAWRASDPRHAQAVQQLSERLSPFRQLQDSGVSSAALGQAASRASRRAALRSVFMLAGVSTTGVLAWRVGRSDLMADERTGVAQRRESLLPGGGSVVLDARTAMDVSSDASQQRILTLHRGRMLADTGADSPALLVRTCEGTLHASGARFVAQVSDERTKVVVMAGRVTAATESGERVQVDAGQQLLLDEGARPALQPASGAADLWTRGLMAMNDEPLGELVAELRNYRSGLLRIDDAAARIRISGVFSLDDTDSTLRALASTQPVRISERTKYWVNITAA